MINESEILELLNDNKIDEVYDIIYEEFVKTCDNVEHIKNIVAMLLMNRNINKLSENSNPHEVKITLEILNLEEIMHLINQITENILKINVSIEDKDDENKIKKQIVKSIITAKGD